MDSNNNDCFGILTLFVVVVVVGMCNVDAAPHIKLQRRGTRQPPAAENRCEEEMLEMFHHIINIKLHSTFLALSDDA